MDGKWLLQKLSQNGFDLEDLSNQTGLSVEKLSYFTKNDEADKNEWNLILSTFNEYPALRYPSVDILENLKEDIKQFGSEAPVKIYYGVNQAQLIFTEYECLGNGHRHGTNVPVDYLSSFTIPLKDAYTLFKKQQYTIENEQVLSV